MLQKRAVRVVDKAQFRDHASKMFEKYRILKFNDLVKFHTCVFMYKASNVMLPENVQTQFCKNQDIHKYSTRNKENMYVHGNLRFGHPP